MTTHARLALVWLALLGCAHDVNQDTNTGPDGVIDGAVAIPLVDGHGQTTDVVTYPGGDRVDWKRVELPATEHGPLDIRMTWEPAEPGLQLAFDVFDATARPIVTSQPTSRRGHVRTATVIDAMGTYYIRIYAVSRADAGSYNLELVFHPTAATRTAGSPAPAVAIPAPPPLPGTPPFDPECDDATFNPKNPACKTVCPSVGAPPGWPGCAGTCVTLDPNNPTCQKTAPCPTPPDLRFKSCMPSGRCDPADPSCIDERPPRPAPVNGRVIHTEIVDDGLLITISVGLDAGIASTWRARAVRADGTDVGDGAITILRVGKRATIGRTKLSNAAIIDSPLVRFDPPPAR